MAFGAVFRSCFSSLGNWRMTSSGAGTSEDRKDQLFPSQLVPLRSCPRPLEGGRKRIARGSGSRGLVGPQGCHPALKTLFPNSIPPKPFCRVSQRRARWGEAADSQGCHPSSDAGLFPWSLPAPSLPISRGGNAAQNRPHG